MDKPRRAKRRLALPAIIAGGLSSMLLAFSLTPTFSALTAAITNDSNTVGTGSLVMQETGPNNAGTQVTCTSGAAGTATCSTINKFGGDNPTTSGYMALKPGGSTTTTVKFKNIGSVSASTFTVAGGTITKANNGSVNGTASVAALGSAFKIKITSGSNTVFDDTATAFAATASSPLTIPGAVAVNGEVTLTITTTLQASADATTQGLSITQPIVWTFNA
ncbi:MAG: hypothetical protein J0I14_07045 [Propionibacteriaceae bacterium]|nr:hypothetical protein [Propionibacteriaceae bacterium]